MPETIGLGFFNMEKPDTALATVCKEFSLAKFLEVFVKIRDLQSKRHGGVTQGQSDQSRVFDLDKPTLTFHCDPRLAGGCTHRTPTQSAMVRTHAKLTSVLMPDEDGLHTTIIQTNRKILGIERIYCGIQVLDGRKFRLEFLTNFIAIALRSRGYATCFSVFK